MADDFRQNVLDATGLLLPDAYLELLDAGRLRFGESRDDWQANWQTILTTSPPALICAPWFMTVEWRPIDELIAWTAPDNWKPNRFVSFAGNGYGDQWVWDPDQATAQGTPIVLCRHDENKAEVVAGTFDEFLYRILIEGFANISFDSRDGLDVDDEEFKRYLKLNVQTVANHLPAGHLATLEAILNNDFHEDQDEERLYLIPEEEKNAILQHDLSSAVGTIFEHMV